MRIIKKIFSVLWKIIDTVFFLLWVFIKETFNMACDIAIVACKVMLFFLTLGLIAGFEGIE